MKTLNVIVKVLAALVAAAGAVYIAATYGEQIVAWSKKTLASLRPCQRCEKADETAEEPAAEEAPAEDPEVPAEEVPAEEPAPEIVVNENEPVAEETDFAE